MFFISSDDNKTFKINVNLSQIVTGDDIVTLSGKVFSNNQIKKLKLQILKE